MTAAEQPAPRLTEAGILFLLEHRKVCPVPSLTIREALVAIESEAASDAFQKGEAAIAALLDKRAAAGQPPPDPPEWVRDLQSRAAKYENAYQRAKELVRGSPVDWTTDPPSQEPDGWWRYTSQNNRDILMAAVADLAGQPPPDEALRAVLNDAGAFGHNLAYGKLGHEPVDSFQECSQRLCQRISAALASPPPSAAPPDVLRHLLQRWLVATRGGDPSLRSLWEETEEILVATLGLAAGAAPERVTPPGIDPDTDMRHYPPTAAPPENPVAKGIREIRAAINDRPPAGLLCQSPWHQESHSTHSACPNCNETWAAPERVSEDKESRPVPPMEAGAAISPSTVSDQHSAPERVSGLDVDALLLVLWRRGWSVSPENGHWRVTHGYEPSQWEREEAAALLQETIRLSEPAARSGDE